jgi:hypothetical protein
MPRLFPHNAFHGIRSIGSKAALSRQRVICQKKRENQTERYYEIENNIQAEARS